MKKRSRKYFYWQRLYKNPKGLYGAVISWNKGYVTFETNYTKDNLKDLAAFFKGIDDGSMECLGVQRFK